MRWCGIVQSRAIWPSVCGGLECRHLFASRASCLVRNSPSSRVKMSFVTAHRLYLSRNLLHSCSMSAVFPLPTGPPVRAMSDLIQSFHEWEREENYTCICLPMPITKALESYLRFIARPLDSNVPGWSMCSWEWPWSDLWSCSCLWLWSSIVCAPLSLLLQQPSPLKRRKNDNEEKEGRFANMRCNRNEQVSTWCPLCSWGWWLWSSIFTFVFRFICTLGLQPACIWIFVVEDGIRSPGHFLVELPQWVDWCRTRRCRESARSTLHERWRWWWLWWLCPRPVSRWAFRALPTT